jgi:hypothetical protein
VTNKELASSLPHAVAREILLGRRESLTIAGELGVPVAVVNEALLRLQDLCHGCISLHQHYGGEPRVVATVVSGESLRRVAWNESAPPARDSG